MRIKTFCLSLILAATAMLTHLPHAYAASGFIGEEFTKVFYFESGGKGSGSALSAANAAALSDKTLWAIPAGTVIRKVYAVIDTAVTGTTDLDIGDDDSGNGFLDGSGSLTLGTPGMYGWSAKVAGSYLRTQTAGATDAADIYVVPNAKYYSASGKSLIADFTGTNTAGKLRIVVEGYRLGGS